MRSVFITVFILSIAVIVSCNKGGYGPPDDNGPHVPNPSDTTAPALDIYTPTDAQVFTSGNSINITGKVVDSGGLYRGSIRVVNDANGQVMKEQAYEIHSVISYSYNISYIASVTALSNYTITVSFEDHGLNITSKSIKVRINP
jgi:hypothetical protein